MDKYMESISLQELKDKHLGRIGTERRDDYEFELRVDILSELIKQLRKEQHMTQEDLGKRIGVQRAQVSKLENNATNVTVGTILRVFRALNAQINFTVEKREDRA